MHRCIARLRFTHTPVSWFIRYNAKTPGSYNPLCAYKRTRMFTGLIIKRIWSWTDPVFCCSMWLYCVSNLECTRIQEEITFQCSLHSHSAVLYNRVSKSPRIYLFFFRLFQVLHTIRVLLLLCILFFPSYPKVKLFRDSTIPLYMECWEFTFEKNPETMTSESWWRNDKEGAYNVFLSFLSFNGIRFSSSSQKANITVRHRGMRLTAVPAIRLRYSPCMKSRSI